MKPLILAALSVPALIAGAAGMQSAHQDMHRHLHEVLVQKLNLTKEQQTAIHKIVEAHQLTLHAEGTALVQARAELVHALVDPKTTESQIRDMEAKGSVADLALELEISRMVKEIDPLLTEAQRVQAGQLMAEFHGHIEGFLAGLHGGDPSASHGQH